MKIFDGHTHMGMQDGVKDVLTELEKAGVYGSCIFSPRPKEYNPQFGVDFEQRLDAVLKFTEGNRERLFPILWIDPREENIFEKIDIAVERGIDAFKIICSTIYVYEEQSIAVLKHIASRNKPVFFHSGILWDGKVSSAYNRPMNWEALLPIKGLRFSMGHCSWPWIDECIAMYGKFLNSANKGTTEHAEMFLDLTPGTPDIYREELLTKIFTIGYDFNHNVFFGTDCYSQDYNATWAKHWLESDCKIMDKLGVSAQVRENIYYNNLLRFLGKTDEIVEHARPREDNSNAWSPVNPQVKEIICKWYDKIGFDRLYRADFETALAEIPVADCQTIENYNLNETDGRRNFITFLYFCEALEKQYREKGIPADILMDTLRDVECWLETWSAVKGGMYLGELSWLKRHFSMQLFTLGRLQFCMGEAEEDIPQIGVLKGEPVLEVHIPEGAAMTPEVCEASFAKAKAFFAKYFPEFAYKCFTCHSWLLDDSLVDILGADSNIIHFQNRFTLVRRDESDALFGYIFGWKTTRYQAIKACCSSTLAAKVQKRARAGGKFYEVLGYIKK